MRQTTNPCFFVFVNENAGASSADVKPNKETPRIPPSYFNTASPVGLTPEGVYQSALIGAHG
eukprot:6056797-Pyramimonas_sp.AAC.2